LNSGATRSIFFVIVYEAGHHVNNMLKSIILGGSKETVSNSITSGDTLLNVIKKRVNLPTI